MYKRRLNPSDLMTVTWSPDYLMNCSVCVCVFFEWQSSKGTRNLIWPLNPAHTQSCFKFKWTIFLINHCLSVIRYPYHRRLSKLCWIHCVIRTANIGMEHFLLSTTHGSSFIDFCHLAQIHWNCIHTCIFSSLLCRSVCIRKAASATSFQQRWNLKSFSIKFGSNSQF